MEHQKSFQRHHRHLQYRMLKVKNLITHNLISMDHQKSFQLHLRHLRYLQLLKVKELLNRNQMYLDYHQIHLYSVCLIKMVNIRLIILLLLML